MATKPILIICEKNKAAQKIADILSKNKATKKGTKVPYYEYTSNSTLYQVVGLRGHVLELDFDSKYQKWRSIKPNDLVDKDPILTPKHGDVLSLLKKLHAKCGQVIIATDFDREGELIGVETYKYIDPNAKVPVFRSKFSSLTPKDINNAFSSLVAVDYNMAAAGEARQIVDLLWGATLTRTLTMSSPNQQVLSVGRVQSPTLALIKKREDDIKAFVPETYYQLQAVFSTGKAPVAETFVGHHNHGNFSHKEKAQFNALMKKLKAAQKGIITDIQTRNNTLRPPTPFSTTDFLKAATGLGFSAAKAMSVAESLYTAGFISYPRTDNTVYPKNLSLSQLVSAIKNVPCVKSYVAKLSGPYKATRGKKETTDHPPIHPVQALNYANATADEKKIYELVVRRFLATISPDCKTQSTTVTTDVLGETFESKGSVILVDGWREVYPYNASDLVQLPKLSLQQNLDVDEINDLTKETKPPARYSEARLLETMEKLGLGTKSTRHSIIKKLRDREFITGKAIAITPLGDTVAAMLLKHGGDVAKTDLTADLEKEMDDVAAASMTKADLIKDSRTALRKIIKTLDTRKSTIRKEMLESSSDTVGGCDDCGKGLLVIRESRAGKRFVSCSAFPDCKNSHPLPQKGKITVSEDPCKICGLLRPTIKPRGKAEWTFCVDKNCKGNVIIPVGATDSSALVVDTITGAVQEAVGAQGSTNQRPLILVKGGKKLVVEFMSDDVETEKNQWGSLNHRYQVKTSGKDAKEGDLLTSSKPLNKKLAALAKANGGWTGLKVSIKRTGKGYETKYDVKVV